MNYFTYNSVNCSKFPISFGIEPSNLLLSKFLFYYYYYYKENKIK